MTKSRKTTRTQSPEIAALITIFANRRDTAKWNQFVQPNTGQRMAECDAMLWLLRAPLEQLQEIALDSLEEREKAVKAHEARRAAKV